ncbi:hypothetical protein [Clostridium beijerinckii]|uniref:Uncharacterized protein n=1 Tax=Clostridium beijerinckii TaxID=1520 RepID=A0AAX0B230_CLOBE|nr:hypothetical protein [Clostridium beijerinckii]NRT88919.1 hypothetical protein [Clostridium beijerinckii]NYC74374.1 hypothetical protein [Clostridium beijerinckii]
MGSLINSIRNEVFLFRKSLIKKNSLIVFDNIDNKVINYKMIKSICIFESYLNLISLDSNINDNIMLQDKFYNITKTFMDISNLNILGDDLSTCINSKIYKTIKNLILKSSFKQ